MSGKRFLSVITFFAIAFAVATPAFSQNKNKYDTFLDSLKTNITRQAYGNKWKRGDYRHRVPYRHIISTPIVPDSSDMAYHEKKNFWRAGAEVFGLNMGLWAFDRYALKGHYAFISWETIKENFKHGFEWDNDHLNTNMFAHPYNGSMFYNAGRSNGFNYWQSELFAIGGSAMWEMFMEREYPSTNDIIATPVGGAALGEVFYRASDLVLNDRASGGERIGREVAAFILDPMRGITRIVTGQAWKKRATTGRRFGLPPISIEASLGARYLTMIDNEGWKIGPAAEINIEYGDRFEHSTKIPYDYFSLNLEIQALSTQPLLGRIEIMGRLLSKELIDKDKLNFNIGLYQHFDFFDSDTIRSEYTDKYLIEYFPETVPYKLGVPASIGGGAMFRFIPNSHMSLDGFLHMNAVPLAGVLTDFYREYHRNYSWGMGYSAKIGINWALSNDKVSIKVADQFYKIITKNNFDSKFVWLSSPGLEIDIIGGDHGITTFNHLEGSVNYKIHKNLFLTGGIDFYLRKTRYEDMQIDYKIPYASGGTTTYYPSVLSKQLGAHVMASYKF
ncbi:MAG: DUF3943 domain-containing protein [Muribaculaceae bacterium]|nr:DUF3943 domain-containing protein [Muribaculaceae bacterium]